METKLETVIKELGLTVESVFVPFSQSRNAKATKSISDFSLNWRVTLKKGGRPLVTTDYSAGIGHCPSYRQGMRSTLENFELIKRECETGFACRRYDNLGTITPNKAKKILPNPIDVIASLVLDAWALNYSGFEDWAGEMGYETDSRKAEKIYKECLEIALKMRNGIGEDGLRRLQDAAGEY